MRSARTSVEEASWGWMAGELDASASVTKPDHRLSRSSRSEAERGPTTQAARQLRSPTFCAYECLVQARNDLFEMALLEFITRFLFLLECFIVFLIKIPLAAQCSRDSVPTCQGGDIQIDTFSETFELPDPIVPVEFTEQDGGIA